MKIMLIGKKSAWIPDAGINMFINVSVEVKHAIGESLLAQNSKNKQMFKEIHEKKKGSE